MAKKKNNVSKAIQSDVRSMSVVRLGFFIFTLLAVAMIIVAYMAIGTPIVAVGTVVILEGALAALLRKVLLPIQIFIGGIGVVIGFLIHQGPFALTMVVVYICAIVVLRLCTYEH